MPRDMSSVGFEPRDAQMSHIPHLNALRTFLVAARHLNFTTTAAELQVSPSAVSHQIKTLEDYLETRLFTRQARRMFLTREGEYLFHSLDNPFRQISDAVDQMKSLRSSKSVSVLCRPFFSSHWLTPRLRYLWAAHPNIDLNLIHKSSFTLADVDKVDLAILWGKGDWPDMESRCLVRGSLTPIMGRALARTHGIPKTPADLQNYTLLHEESKLNWVNWLNLAGVPQVTGAGSMLVDDTNVRFQHVLNGQGIMLSSPRLLSDLLACGELIRPFRLELEGYSYYLAWPRNRPMRARAAKVSSWLISETEDDADEAESRPPGQAGSSRLPQDPVPGL
ncbi:MAG TPA: LysR substrate-binding domain-containing protein [Paracoccus sp. (in: a-proteobacteria)]|nr:LysR substrate-binding domain-containing protein [Paracoccus sp. (in: a-proteobacteria)]